MMQNRSGGVALVAVALFVLCCSSVVNAQSGHFARPHDIAVHDGDVIATSVGSDSVSIIYDGDTTPTYFDIGAHSWGVCFADSLAYVTRPSTTSIAVVNLVSADSTQYITVPKGCTEIIASADGQTLYVANVGKSIASSGSGKWKHSIVVVDLTTGFQDSEFETERQPRALALSPDGDRLFVGTVQGALGQAGIDSTYVDASNGFKSTHDGGSIIVHDLATSVGDPLYRFAVGSPVRGICALPDSIYSPSSHSGDYRVYFTNVGFGVQSEAPLHGGTLIPNVISSILMSSGHVPQSRQDTVFKHLSTYSPPDPMTNDGLPAVLPEKIIAIADDTKSGYEASLWVTNSASGTLSRAWITSSGAIATGQSSEALAIPAVSEVEDDGSFAYTFGDALGLSTTTELVDIELADLNANGVLDVIAVPDGGGDVEVFSGYGEEADREYRDGTEALALGSDEAFGVVAADFNRDTDVDLFFMRPEIDGHSEAFFWANALVDSVADSGEEPAFSIQLRTLSATTDSATTASGATVTSKVSTGEGRVLYSTQIVDGGSGGGGQGADRLVFGLADASSAEVTVIWPDGQEQVVDIATTDDDFPHYVLTDEWNPGILNNTISASYTLGVGTVTWTFSWKTQMPCDGARVFVETDAPPGDCRAPLGHDTSKTLSSGDSNVTWTQVASGSNWQQTLSWTTTCASRCNYDYTVKSVVARTVYSGPEKLLKITTCPIPVP